MYYNVLFKSCLLGLVIVPLILFLIACNDGYDLSESDYKEPQISKETIEIQETDNKMEMGAEIIKIDYPLEQFDFTSKEQFDNYCVEAGFEKIDVDKDNGIAHITMTSKRYEELKQQVREEIQGIVNDLIDEDGYSNIKRVEYSEDYSECNVYTTSTELSLLEQLAATVFYTGGHAYGVRVGHPIDDVKVKFYNAESNALLGEGSSKEYFAKINENASPDSINDANENKEKNSNIGHFVR